MSYLPHKPIQITNCNLSFPNKVCFENFTTNISYGDHIVIIGRNGSGKSTLLKMIQNGIDGIQIPADVKFGYVPQDIDLSSLSGGERFNEALNFALSKDPNILLLDEPTNHLDRHNRKKLIQLLQNFQGSLIIVSHDTELLKNSNYKLWHVDDGKIHIFSGNYDDYISEIHSKRTSVENELSRLERKKKDIHNSLMQEEKRAAKSAARGSKNIDQRKWPTIVSKAKAGRAQETSGRKKSAIDHKKHGLQEQLQSMRLPEIILPKFSLSSDIVSDRILVSIRDGAIGYNEGSYILQNINFSLSSRERLAIMGNNGSGKSTLVKAILGETDILRKGDWHVPKQEDIGYLDQHYNNLDPTLSVFDNVATLVSSWSYAEVRKHLNDFLFRKNEEVNILGVQLSGGEKARLSLAQIAAKTPKLLILDEVTNNLDLETRNHVIQVLKHYPSAMIVISHDEYFLAEIEAEKVNLSFYSSG